MDGFTCLKNPFMVLLPSASLYKKQKLLDWFSLLGKAYIFNRNGSSWSQQAQLTASDCATFDRFGFSGSVSGDYAIVGAAFKIIATNTRQGKAYIFNRNGRSWSQQAQSTAIDGAFDDRFGYSVGISGNNIICGAPQKSIDSNFQQGKVYFFNRN
jgi:hypothetical protein